MFRNSCTVILRLILALLSLMLAGCGGLPVSATPSLTITASPPPSPTRELNDSASKIDETLSALSAEEEFAGAVLVAQNGEVLLSRGYGLADREKNLLNTPPNQVSSGLDH